MLDYLLFSAALFVTTFIFYLAVMKLRDARDQGILNTLNWSVIWLAYAILYVGLVLDMLLDWIVLTVMFLELPKEILSTSRVKRHKNHGEGWRKSLATWLCNNFLSPFDPTHCSG
jgi:hypothetical protein